MIVEIQVTELLT